MGSKVLWAMKGALYVRSIILAAFLKAASGFPSFLLSITSPDTKAFSSLFTCIAELSNSPVVSQLAFRAFLACINSQVESPTIAINCLKPFSSNPPGSSTVVSTIKASLTPGILFISASLKSFIVMPNAGGCCIMASCIPSLWKSSPNKGWPVTIFLPSTFLILLPINLKSLTPFSSTSFGTSIPTALEAISP